MDEKLYGLSPIWVTKIVYMNGNFMAKYGMKLYHVLKTRAKKILADIVLKTKVKGVSTLKLVNFTAYNELILAQEEVLCFQIVEEVKKKVNKYRDARQARIKVSINLSQAQGILRQGYEINLLSANYMI